MRELFEESLEKMRIKYDFYINAYVVMPEHVHLLISEPKRAILAKAHDAITSLPIDSEPRRQTVMAGRYRCKRPSLPSAQIAT
ncbi:transposase [Granulicella mallensis]|uniref:transposase n=1 Tax=Granulicella mallensis TaxID=940614 RepID=UPI001CBAD6CF